MIRILCVHGYNGKPNGESFLKLAKYAEVADFDGEKVKKNQKKLKFSETKVKGNSIMLLEIE